MTEFMTAWRIGALCPLDLLVLTLCLGLLFVIAFVAGRKEADTRDFFLGRRGVPGIVACLSFVATEVSAVTITQNPATGYSENLQYLQFFLGSAASKVFVAFLFLPMFYKHECTSIYEFLRHRFGPGTQRAGALFFFLTRLAGSGVRLYAACLAVAIIFGGRGDGTDGSLEWTLLVFTVVSIAFIGFGGIKAIVWTGAYETVFFYLAGGAVAVYLLAQVGWDWGEIRRVAGPAGRLSVFNFGEFCSHLWNTGHVKPGLLAKDLNDATTFWAGTANAFFIGLAVFGTDQEMVQRLLTVKTRRSSQKAILYTILAALPILLIYLGLGTLLFVYYHQRPEQLPPGLEAKQVFPHFITTALPMGLKGLVLAAIILASIDSPLGSLSSSFVSDIYRPLIRPRATEKHYLRVSRACVVGFGILLALIAYACLPVRSVLWLAFQVVSVTGGSMLGIFLLGLLTRRGSNAGNIVAMTVSALGMLALLVLAKYGPIGLRAALGLTTQPVPPKEGPIVPIAWSWLIVIGTVTTFALGYVLDGVFGNRAAGAAAAGSVPARSAPPDRGDRS